jgi:hypothetical protein
MAKAYTFTEQKRAWAANVSKGLKRYAEVSRCPKCDRKNAFHKQSEEYTIPRGFTVRKCRYCKFKKVHYFQTGLDEETWEGPKTCIDCERRDRHDHCTECGSTRHGAAYCDNLG